MNSQSKRGTDNPGVGGVVESIPFSERRMYVVQPQGPPVASWGLLGPSGASWGLLGLPGASSGLLGFPGASWSLLGPPEAFWDVLGRPGASWGLLGSPGASWGLSWALLGPPWAPWCLLGPPGSSWALSGASWGFTDTGKPPETSSQSGPIGVLEPAPRLRHPHKLLRKREMLSMQTSKPPETFPQPERERTSVRPSLAPPPWEC